MEINDEMEKDHINLQDQLEERLEAILEQTRRQPGLSLYRISKILMKVFSEDEINAIVKDLKK